MKNQPAWNLSDLYSGLQDPGVWRSLEKAKRAAGLFARAYRGKVVKRLKFPSQIYEALQGYERIMEQAAKPLIYAGLLFAECATDPRRGAFLQRVKAGYVEVSNLLVFFELELLGLGAAPWKSFLNAAALRRFRNYLEQLYRSKKHRLSEAEEKLLSDRDLTGRAAFIRLFEQELASKEFLVKLGGKKRRCSETETLDLLYSPKRELRRAAAQGLSAGLKEESKRLTFIFNTLAEDKSVLDRYQRFATPEASRHLANQIEQAQVDAMTSVVCENYQLVQKFYQFKRRVLGLERLYDYDRYAPLGKTSKSYSFAGAKAAVIGAFDGFCPEYGRIAREFFEKRWIDAAARPGKRSGAFCQYGTSDLHPYVFVNFNGAQRDVFTLAHELGHGAHAYLMRGAGYLNFDVPLTMAETASVFSEMLLFDQMRGKLAGRRELMELYIAKIESIFATVFRQVAMYRFEQDLHGARRSRGELSVLEINALWRGRQREMFGSAVELTHGYDYWWSYIPHFLRTPFYVYAYAFGELLTLALFMRYRTQGAGFVPRYLEMLAAGGSKTPQELVKPLGVDLKRRDFWREGMKLLSGLVEEEMDK